MQENTQFNFDQVRVLVGKMQLVSMEADVVRAGIKSPDRQAQFDSVPDVPAILKIAEDDLEFQAVNLFVRSAGNADPAANFTCWIRLNNVAGNDEANACALLDNIQMFLPVLIAGAAWGNLLKS